MSTANTKIICWPYLPAWAAVIFITLQALPQGYRTAKSMLIYFSRSRACSKYHPLLYLYKIARISCFQIYLFSSPAKCEHRHIQRFQSCFNNKWWLARRNMLRYGAGFFAYSESLPLYFKLRASKRRRHAISGRALLYLCLKALISRMLTMTTLIRRWYERLSNGWCEWFSSLSRRQFLRQSKFTSVTMVGERIYCRHWWEISFHYRY